MMSFYLLEKFSYILTSLCVALQTPAGRQDGGVYPGPCPMAGGVYPGPCPMAGG